MCLPGTVEKVRESQPTITRRTVLAGGGAAALAALLPGEAVAHRRGRGRGHGRDHRGRRGKVVDLTHEFTAGFPVYVGDAPSRRTLTSIDPDGFYKQEWTFDEHSGTHMDAPAHFVAGGRFTPQLKARELVLPIVVIDIADRAAVGSRHRRRRGRPAALRAAARADPGRRARRDGLRLGREGRRRGRVQGRRSSATTTSPASVTRRSSTCSTGARRRRSASTP